MTRLTSGPVLMRAALIPATLVLFVLVSGFLAQVRWATDLWPWPAKPLSYIFIASILAAIAVPVLWIALTGEAAAVRAGALDLTVMYGGMFVYVLTLTGNPHEPRLWPYALAFGLATAGSAGAFLFARLIPWADPRSMPQPVRLSFGAFAIILIGAGVALLVHASIFPWRLGPETSVMFGLIFLGAATYFIYGALDPHWGNAVGQLAGFLAYDLVLLAPFFEHFSTAQGGSRVSLIIYVAFLIYSGTLASYYLFASKATRIRLALIGPDSLRRLLQAMLTCGELLAVFAARTMIVSSDAFPGRTPARRTGWSVNASTRARVMLGGCPGALSLLAMASGVGLRLL